MGSCQFASIQNIIHKIIPKTTKPFAIMLKFLVTSELPNCVAERHFVIQWVVLRTMLVGSCIRQDTLGRFTAISAMIMVSISYTWPLWESGRYPTYIVWINIDGFGVYITYWESSPLHTILTGIRIVASFVKSCIYSVVFIGDVHRNANR